MSETADQKQTRRRWINLAELVAVAGLIVGALTLWTNWSEQRAAKEEKAAEKSATAQEKARFELRGKASADGKSIALVRDEAHELHDVRVTFPSALGVAPQDAVGHEIDAKWFAEPILKLTDGGSDRRTGRLPVLVTYSYSAEDDELSRTAIYDIIWSTKGHFLSGRSLTASDFRLRARGGDQKRLDAIWAKERPAPVKG